MGIYIGRMTSVPSSLAFSRRVFQTPFAVSQAEAATVASVSAAESDSDTESESAAPLFASAAPLPIALFAQDDNLIVHAVSPRADFVLGGLGE
jgi:hypothetical protein